MSGSHLQRPRLRLPLGLRRALEQPLLLARLHTRTRLHGRELLGALLRHRRLLLQARARSLVLRQLWTQLECSETVFAIYSGLPGLRRMLLLTGSAGRLGLTILLRS